MKKNVAILIVEPDELVQFALEQILKTHGYYTQIAENARSALYYLDNQPVDGILMELKLPDTSGLQLLKSLQRRHDVPPIVVITEADEKDSTIAAFRAGARDVVSRPVKIAQLIETLERVFEKVGKVSGAVKSVAKAPNPPGPPSASAAAAKSSGVFPRLLQKIRQNKNLVQVQPQVYLKLRKLSEDPGVSNEQIAQTVSLDPFVSAKVMNLASSAYYSSSSRNQTLQEAISRLGLNEVIRLVSLLELKRSVDVTIVEYRDVARELWKFTVGVAFMMKLLGEVTRHEEPDSLYLSGLMHNVGKPYLLKLFANVIAEDGFSIDPEAVLSEIGIHFKRFSQILLRQWELPSLYNSIARYYTLPQDRLPIAKPTDELNVHYLMLHLALDLVKGTNFVDPIPSSSPINREDVIDQLEIEEDALQPLPEKLKTTLDSLAALFS